MLKNSSSRRIADIVAGISVAFILLPEAVAYAAIAHVAIQAAFTAALAGLLCYAALGKSRFAIVAPTSSSAALLAAAVSSLHPFDEQMRLELSGALVILTGASLLVLAKAGLGRLSAFVSRPVLHGFAFALALTIIIKQLPIFLGVTVSAPDPVRLLIRLIARAEEWSLWSAAMGLSTLLVLRLLKRWPLLPGTFMVLAVGIALSITIDLNHFQIALVGPVHITIPTPNKALFSTEKWLQLAELAIGIVVIIVAESWGSIRNLALLHNDSIEPNRELAALGAANLVSGLLQGMPVGAGFSVSSANEQAGAYSKSSGVIAAGILLLMAVLGQPLIAKIPEPMVAAAVIHALSHTLNPKPLLYLWRINRDHHLALAAVIAVLAFGVLHGMLIAIALSLVAAIRSFSKPLVKELAELGNSRDYVDKENHPNAVTHPEILILRPEEPLFFASVEGVLAEIQQRFDSTDKQILIISLEESADFDSTALECLVELANAITRQNKILLLARVKDPIRELLLQFASGQFQNKLFWSVADAVVCGRRLTPGKIS